MSKCILCSDRIDSGDVSTACSQACPTHARIFGDLDSPEMQELIRRGAYVMRPDQRTQPAVYYLPR